MMTFTEPITVLLRDIEKRLEKADEGDAGVTYFNTVGVIEARWPVVKQIIREALIAAGAKEGGQSGAAS